MEEKIQLSDTAKYCDSMAICLTKGLCCPVGSMNIADKEAIGEMRRIRKSIGGGMRQIGVLAAGGLYALEHVLP